MMVEAIRPKHIRLRFSRSSGAICSSKLRIILRGLRAISDYEYETQIAITNRKICPEIETFLLPTSTEYSYLNSTVVKEIAQFGGCIRGLVPEGVEKKLRKKFQA